MYRIHKATNKQSRLLISCLKVTIICLPLALTSILIISSYHFTKLIHIGLLFNCFSTLIKKARRERKNCCCYNKYKCISLLLSFCLPSHFLHVNTPSILKVHFHFAILTLPITFWHYFSYIFSQKAQTLPTLLMKSCSKPAANHSRFSLRHYSSVRTLEKAW